MLAFDKDGWAVDPKITVARRPNLAHGRMTTVSGIIVHQTGAPTASSTLNSYLQDGANGAHFLIDKNGDIYQTGSVFWRQWHVGKLKPRCMLEKRCTPVEVKNFAHMTYAEINSYETQKAVPDRYPSNDDSIGIELVGAPTGTAPNQGYETVTAEQNASLAWLVKELTEKFGVPMTEVFRHPAVSRKNEHEAESARW